MMFALRELSHYALHRPERPRYQWRTMHAALIEQDPIFTARYDFTRAKQRDDPVDPAKHQSRTEVRVTK
jgi:hypothetical protein